MHFTATIFIYRHGIESQIKGTNGNDDILNDLESQEIRDSMKHHRHRKH